MQETKIWDIIIRSLQAEASKEELAALQNWMQQSKENKKLYNDIKKIWNDTEMITVSSSNFDADAAWQKINKRITEYDSKVKQLQPVATTNKWLKIAAAILVLFTIGATSYFVYDNVAVKDLVAQTNASQMQEIVLADGTKIILNKNTQVTYPDKFNGATREITLDGEAFFEVAKDSAKPFIIHTFNSNVQVLGTSFNVRAFKKSKAVEVDVVTGKVAFSDISGKQKVYLLPGDKGTLDTENKLAVSQTVDNNFNAWQSKRMVFSNTKLDRVLGTLENFFEVEFKVSNQKIYDCYFTATFDQPNINEVLQVLSVSMGVTYTKKDNVYYLNGNGCN
ncbi:MAG: FecR domain-containing protein [Bacteroidota bacterium]